LDPTTAALVPRTLGRAEQILMNVCWRFWIPLFATLYRINNYWHLPRLRSLFTKREDRRHFTISILAYFLVYVAVTILVGPKTLLRVMGFATVLAFVVEDLLILSQHTHIPQNLSQGRAGSSLPRSRARGVHAISDFTVVDFDDVAAHRRSRTPPHVSSRAWLSPPSISTTRPTKSSGGNG
jgi:hypothetical protein